MAPQVTSRPRGASARRLFSHVASPTESSTTFTPRPPRSRRSSFGTSSDAWFSVTSAPSARARSSLASLDDVTITVAPRSFAIPSAARATPPPMPQISTVSPGFVAARVTTIRHAVRCTSGNAAASAHDTVSGTGYTFH